MEVVYYIYLGYFTLIQPDVIIINGKYFSTVNLAMRGLSTETGSFLFNDWWNKCTMNDRCKNTRTSRSRRTACHIDCMLEM
jgi:hypothetical protein